MPMDYNNVKAPFYSQTDRQFATAQNWTAGGIDMLTLYVQGKVGNRAAPLYIGLTDSSNGTALVECPNTLAITTARWTEWTIPFSDFAGVDAARIKKMSLGVGPRTSGTAGGKGTIYVDDIGLSKSHQ